MERALKRAREAIVRSFALIRASFIAISSQGFALLTPGYQRSSLRDSKIHIKELGFA
jgi:hypothetical protein